MGDQQQHPWMDMVERALSKQRPCEQTCCKCGSADVHGRFYPRGKRVELCLGAPPYATERVDWMSREAKEDLIVHYCRYCGHQWDTVPLDAQSEAAKGG